MWLTGTSIYSCFLIGTFAHELGHSRHSKHISAIEIHYDGSGLTKGSFYPHDHAVVYLEGGLITAFLIIISITSILLIMFSKNFRGD